MTVLLLITAPFGAVALTSTSKLTVPCCSGATLMMAQVMVLPMRLPGPLMFLTVAGSKLASNVSVMVTFQAVKLPVLP